TRPKRRRPETTPTPRHRVARSATRRGEPGHCRKFYCARKCVRLSMTWDDTFLEALVRAGAFLFRESLLSDVTVMPGLLRRARQECARGAHEESAKGWSGSADSPSRACGTRSPRTAS